MTTTNTTTEIQFNRSNCVTFQTPKGDNPMTVDYAVSYKDKPVIGAFLATVTIKPQGTKGGGRKKVNLTVHGHGELTVRFRDTEYGTKYSNRTDLDDDNREFWLNGLAGEIGYGVTKNGKNNLDMAEWAGTTAVRGLLEIADELRFLVKQKLAAA